MAVTTTRLGVVIDALVARLKASPTFADPVQVYDGPITMSSTMFTQAVFVGFAGDFENAATDDLRTSSGAEAVLVNQELLYVGNTSVRETLEVRCAAVANSGDPNTQLIRNQCLAMVNGVEQVLRSDPTLGVDGSTVATLQVGTFLYAFDPGDGSILSRLEFTVHVLTTLLTV